MIRKIIIATALICLNSGLKAQMLKDGTKTLGRKFKNMDKFDQKILQFD